MTWEAHRGIRWSDLMADIATNPTPHATKEAERAAVADDTARILAIADQVYLADDTDSAFVAEQMRDAVARGYDGVRIRWTAESGYIGEPVPDGWVTRAIRRLSRVRT